LVETNSYKTFIHFLEGFENLVDFYISYKSGKKKNKYLQGFQNLAGNITIKIFPKTKPSLLFSPDGSENPFAFFFKKQKIEANSRNPYSQKLRNHSLLAK
jgi:hypothetical protein